LALIFLPLLKPYPVLESKGELLPTRIRQES